MTRSTSLFVAFMIMNCPDWLSHPVISVVSTVLVRLCLSYIISSIFIEVFVITVDTIMLCYCEDMRKNGTDGVAEGAIGNKASAQQEEAEAEAEAEAGTNAGAEEETTVIAAQEAYPDAPPDAPEAPPDAPTA